MKKSYLKGAMITFVFIFITFGIYIYSANSAFPLFSPSTTAAGFSFGFQSILSFVLGILVVLLAFFMIMSILE